MSLIVHKYGGTSMGSTERIRNVAKRVAKWARAGHHMVVVPSAMSGETNRLIDLAKQISEQPLARELDVMVSTGEQVTIALLAMAVPIYSFYYYLRDKLGIQWRRWMTFKMMARYFEGNSFYHLVRNEKIDNPDQRIAEDLRLFTTGTLGFALGLLREATTLASFIGILWMVSGPLDFTLGGQAYSIPGYMLWGALLYALIGSTLTWWIGRPLIEM